MSALYIIMNFNPRAPCGARPHWMTFVAAAALFQSTRPVWGATVSQGPFFAEDIVSIHAPRVGRDVQPVTSRIITPSFNPRAPCGARHVLLFSVGFYLSFNPRAPCGARRAAVMPTLSGMGFNPRAPCGARLTEGKIDGGAGGVSIHAPRVGRDGNWSHDFPLLPRIYGHSPPQIRFSRHLSPTPLLRHDSRTYIFTFCFLFTSPSHSVMNAQMMIAASKS